ncbi:MAG: hypothetical protein KDI69_00685 [Xanthomonadales bacterium]|jgi:hypothetical protein|nr:hypothetical protein [Xanthomonadales bacterium]
MYSIPVYCDAHGSKGMLHGVVHLEDGGIRLEYQTGDAVLQRLRSKSEELIAPFDALTDVRYRAGFLWMSPKIEIEFSDFGLVSRVPAGHSGKLVFQVPRDNRAMAQKFVETLDGELALQRRTRLEKDIQRLSRVEPRSAMESVTPNDARSPD